MQWPPIAMWLADIDYVRLTARHYETVRTAYELYLKVSSGVLAMDTGEEPHWEPWFWQGYAGQSCGSIQVGQRYDGSLVQAAGWRAAALSDYPLPWDKCPRLDIALTFWLTEDVPSLAEQFAEAAVLTSGRNGTRRFMVKLIKGYGNGDTAYLGSRSSNRYLRFYDKYRESGHQEEYRNAWRLEAEYKNDLATALWETAPRSGNRSPWAAAIVLGELQRKAIVVPAIEAVAARVGFKPPVNDDPAARRMAWLATQVKPAVEKLIGWGIKPSYIGWLIGINDYPEP